MAVVVARNISTNEISVTGGTSVIPATLDDIVLADQDVAGNYRNLLKYTEDFTNAVWVTTGTIATKANAPDFIPGIKAWKIKVNDSSSWFSQSISGLIDSARYEPSFWIKRISTSGNLILMNPSGSDYGRWVIDLSLLSDQWVKITRNNVAVSVVYEYTARTTAGSGILWWISTGGPVSFYVAAPQLELAYYDTINVYGDGYPLSVSVTANTYYNTINVTGSISPDATGTYTAKGTFGTIPYYQRGTDNYFIWWVGAGNNYYLSTELGVTTVSWIKDPSTSYPGNYTVNVGGTTGTATVAFDTDSGFVLNPDISGTYDKKGYYNSYPYYQRGTDSYFIWVYASAWNITTELGSIASYRWKVSNSGTVLIRTDFMAVGASGAIGRVGTTEIDSYQMNPDISGQYTYKGLYNEKHYYQRGIEDFYVWYDHNASKWCINEILGISSNTKWTSSSTSISDTYTPHGDGKSTRQHEKFALS